MYNNASLVMHLGRGLQDVDSDSQAQPIAAPRPRVEPEPCLLARLPSTGFLQREAELTAPKSVIKQLRRTPTPPLSPVEADEGADSDSEQTTEEPDENPELDDACPSRPRKTSFSSVLSAVSSARSLISRRKDETKPWKEPQPYEIFRAVEHKDIMFLMEIRDRAFHLLLRKSGDATPLLHAMRIGRSHQDVAILLLGAFSRYINQLQDAEITSPRTKVLLKALRTNLKLAIDFGLHSSQSDLIASFLQTLIMSEGDRWVASQTSAVALALRAGTDGKPVRTAETAVRSFATKELGKAKLIATLEDYVANASADLLMMAAWSCALESIQGEPIPFYYFARDDRVYKAFVERLDMNRREIDRAIGRRLRWQFRVLRKVMEGRTTNYRSKVELLAEEFDEGPGVG